MALSGYLPGSKASRTSGGVKSKPQVLSLACQAWLSLAQFTSSSLSSEHSFPLNWHNRPSLLNHLFLCKLDKAGTWFPRRDPSIFTKYTTHHSPIQPRIRIQRSIKIHEQTCHNAHEIHSQLSACPHSRIRSPLNVPRKGAGESYYHRIGTGAGTAVLRTAA